MPTKKEGSRPSLTILSKGMVKPHQRYMMPQEILYFNEVSSQFLISSTLLFNVYALFIFSKGVRIDSF